MLSQYRFLKSYLLQQRGLLALCSVILFVQAFLVLIFPLPIRWAIDTVLAPQNVNAGSITFAGYEWAPIELLCALVGLSLFIGISMTLFEFLDESFTNKSIMNLVNNFRLSLVNTLFSRRFSFVEGKLKVDLLGRLSGDTQNLELFVSTTLVLIFRSIPSLLFAVIAMFVIDSKFALLITLLIPAFYFGITLVSKKLKANEKELRSKTNLFEHSVLQSLNAFSLLKSLQGERASETEIAARQKVINYYFLRSKFFTALLNSIFSSSRHLLRGLVLLLGGWAILKGQLTLGTLFAFVSYLEALNRPIGEIANFLSRYGKASASLERVEEMAKELKLAPETSGTQNFVTRSLNTLRFESVSFAYKNTPPVFENLNLNFKNNQLIAIVGPSGVGKSTFIKLLNRLTDPTQGRITYGETPLQDISLASLRSQIVVISQDPFFLAATVRQNLEFGLSHISDEALWNALEDVNAKEFVQALPLGLDTLIGESGVQLSGGQSKRLSLARGFLRKSQSSIFVFDEPTSGLDPVSANHVMQSLQKLAQEKQLVLFSTHRVSEFTLANEILIFSKSHGPMLATHTDLMTTNAQYQTMVQNEEAL